MGGFATDSDEERVHSPGGEAAPPDSGEPADRPARPVGHFRLSPAGDLLAGSGGEPALGLDSSGGAFRALVGRAQAFVRMRAGAGGPVALEHFSADGSRRGRMVIAPARDPSGALLHFDVFVEDATGPEQARSERDRMFLESVLEALPNPVFVKDERHRWVLLNDSYCRFMGYDRANLIGKSDHDFFPREEADVFWANDDVVFATGTLNENEESFTDAAGLAHVILTRKTLHTDPSGARFLLGVITDITERKQMEDALRRSRDELDERVAERTAELLALNRQLQDEDRRKTEFLALLGHELRNPLTPIRNAVYALQQMGLGPGQERPRAIIERQVAQMSRLIDDLLDVARITRGKILLREARFDLVQLVRTTVDDRAEALEAAQLRVETQFPSAPLPVLGDPARIAQAVENLLDNAQKFSAPGGQIRVEIRSAEGEGAATIVVGDTGIGMSPELMDHLFEPFAQSRASLRRGGLGLGLALVKGLAELHHGSVTAFSHGPGLGSEFAIRLPIASGAADSTSPEGPRPASRKRILVVEDSEDAAESLRMVLEMAGHEVAVARTGAQALETATAFRPEVVLSDIALGTGMSGYDVARALRASPELRAVRLVALTGYGQENDRRQAIEAGFDEHLVKPFEIGALFQLMGRLDG